MPIRTRRELANALELVMSHAYAQLRDRQRLETDTSLLKTYLLEAHAPQQGHRSVYELLETSFGPATLGTTYTTRVRETDEEFFFQVDVDWQRERATFYVDATNQRFWIVYSTSKSTATDPIVRRIVVNEDKLDTAWLPAQLLEEISRLGVLRGLGLDYDRREVPDVDFEAQDAPVEFLKMQLWGNRAADVLRVLRQPNAFPESTTLSKVKVKHWLNREGDEEAFSIGDVKYDGKITARGTSFPSHAALVSSLYRIYSEKVLSFEERFALGSEITGERCSIVGEPLNLIFSHPIPNLTAFTDSLFSGSQPFRLWGVPTRVGDDYYRVAALDLHVSQPLNFEITPDFIRLYLPKGTCGNTVPRLYTNLQHYYDSRVRLETGSGEFPFEF